MRWFTLACVLMCQTVHSDEIEKGIPGMEARPDEARAPQNDTSPALGITVLPLDAKLRDAFRKDAIPNPPVSGVLVARVAPGSPAQRCGVRKMDVVRVVGDGKSSIGAEDFTTWVATLRVGEVTAMQLWRLEVGREGRQTWKQQTIKVTPTTRADLNQEILRFSFLRIDNTWVKLPYLDLTRPSSQTAPFRPTEGGRHYRLKGGQTVWTSDPKRRPPGAVDITAEVLTEKRRKWEETMPTLGVGEFGKVNGFKVVQVVGPVDMIVEIGLDDLGWTRIGVPDRFQLVRLHGFSTKGIVDNTRVSVKEAIVVVDTWAYTTVAGGRKTILRAVSVGMVKDGLSEKDLKQLKEYLSSVKKKDAEESP